MKRRFILLAVATFINTSLMAQWDGIASEIWTSGSGTAGSPYLIETEAHLAYLAKQVNTGNTYSKKYFKQNANLDLGNHQWTPIGNSSYKFAGTYDGNGKTISNLYCCDSSSQYMGLFGNINKATLTKITILNGKVFGNGSTGGICGAAAGSTISYCTNNATVLSRKEQNGGICGYSNKSTTTDCINYGLVSGFNMTGGIVGRCKNGTSDKIYNCINVGQVFSMCATSGNIVGLNDGETQSDIQHCYYDNQISTLGGITRNKTERGLADDVENQYEGKETNDMTNGVMPASYSADDWNFTSGKYPRLNINASNVAIILAATPMTLTSPDKADSVTNNFSVSTANGVSWTSENTEITISGNSVTINNPGSVVLTATVGGFSKNIYLNLFKEGFLPLGNANTPLTINNEADWIALRDAVNNYGTYKECTNYDGFKGVHFIVTGNATLNNWDPIGIHNAFKGYIDGNNDTINITVNQSISGAGLFGYASYGEIKNLIVKGIVNGNELVGGLCGGIFNEKITNCSSECTVSDNNIGKATGGLVGDDRGFSTLVNCTNYGDVITGECGGGILGRAQIDTKLEYCKNFGEINGTKKTGGICGNLTATAIGSTIINCENHGNINALDNETGGIVGGIPSGTESINSIENCINSSNVSGVKHTGGIIGHAYETVTITNCLNIGAITGFSENVGGIAGQSEGTVNILNSLNAGIITGPIGGGISGAAGGTLLCSNCVNIGFVNSNPGNAISTAGTKDNCFNDSQMCTKNGGTTNATTQMLGNALESSLGSNWTYTEGRYPIPSAINTSYYANVASIPLILGDGDKVNSVNKNLFNINDENITWSCSADYIEFVDGYAYISHSSTQDSLVYVTISTQNQDKTYSKTIPLTIKQKDASLNCPVIEWSIDDQIEIIYGSTIQSNLLTATETNGYPGVMTYSIKKDDDSFNTNEILNVGTYDLIAKFTPSNTHIAPVTKIVELIVNQAEPSITWNMPNQITITYGTLLSETQLNATSVSAGTITYTLGSSTGTNVMNALLEVGNYVIYANIAAAGNYSGNSVQKTLIVNQATPTITWNNPEAITYGTALSATQLNASVNVDASIGSISYSENGSPIAIGDVLPATNHIITASFTPNDLNSGNYNPVSTTATIVVNKATPVITWNNPSDITYGTALSGTQLNAVAKFNDVEVSGTYSYSPVAGTTLNAGNEQELTVTFNPSNGNYDSATKTVKINVSKAEPTITWNNPSDITYGTALSATQLNAVAKFNDVEVSGTYTYSPVAGTTLNAGNEQILSVTFNPSNSNYDSATKTVKINVSKAEPTITWN
ncbi:MAG: hypothetical protein IKP62_01495, partial [Salinivirgaceae bacterium]|nr:hypothetical protein [Salinivirgaceae bacterium]